MGDKEIKEKYRKIFNRNPEKFYPVVALKDLGFERRKCEKCNKYFWSVNEKRVCGDSNCSGKYTFLENKIAKKEYNYISLWKKFSEIMKKNGYTPIKRYPVTARWRKDIYFVEASIDDFIPHVISGEVEPPANPLTVPQPCLRFNDIENIGITGEHYSLFTMIGQHRFEKPENYNIDDYLLHLLDWFFKGLKMKKEDITLHEDVWYGSKNFGPCIEIFSGGVELCNQVYMQFHDLGNSYRDLNLKVLDMGLGHERNVWFSKGDENSYEAVFPEICGKLRKMLNIDKDDFILKKFVPYAGLLNSDEISDIELQWRKIAAKINVDVGELKGHILPLSQLYSIIDHSRALLIAISDGTLPSNVSGGYNLRVLLRRALDFIENNQWNINIDEIIEMHAENLKGIFPELMENIYDVREIIEHEVKKYERTKKRMRSILIRIDKVDLKKAIELYESHGITPEILTKYGFKVPENFYNEITKKYERKEEKEEEKFDNLPSSEILYWEDEYRKEFDARVIKSFEKNNKKYVILDKTLFYPVSGGQISDNGFLIWNGEKVEVVDVKKYGNSILHEVNKLIPENSEVRGIINWDRRIKNMRHHTATHILNGVCRKILGNHVWQAGAEKTPEKGRLDITHYKNLSEEELDKIEKMANEIVAKNLRVKKYFMKRNEAERKFGFRIYQGGAVPGNILRIVEIENFDVEACGGTHLNSTGEVMGIKITGSRKIRDGIVRIEFIAGDVVDEYIEEIERIKEEIRNIFGIDEIDLDKLCRIYSVSRKDLIRTLKRFLEEFEKQNEEIKALGGEKIRFKDCYDLFSAWKEQRKVIQRLKEKYMEKLLEELNERDYIQVKIDDVAFLMQLFNKSGRKKLIIGRNCAIGPSNKKEVIEKEFRRIVEKGEMVMGFERKG